MKTLDSLSLLTMKPDSDSVEDNDGFVLSQKKSWLQASAVRIYFPGVIFVRAAWRCPRRLAFSVCREHYRYTFIPTLTRLPYFLLFLIFSWVTDGHTIIWLNKEMRNTSTNDFNDDDGWDSLKSLWISGLINHFFS